jgi:hypothetical protein
MQSFIQWFQTGSLLGIPRTGWAVLSALVGVDVVCAHLKNPRLNHAAGVVALLIQKVMDALRISSIPVFGSGISAFLDIIIGAPAVSVTPPTSATSPTSETPTPVPPGRPKDPPTAA